MKIFLFIFSQIIPIYCIRQTCIVAVKTKDKIMVGTESRVGRTTYDTFTGQSIYTFSDTTCKISTYGSYNFSFSTRIFGNELKQLAKDCLSTATSFKQLEETYAKRSVHLIFNKIDSINKINSKYVDTTIKIDQQIASVIFFGIEKGSLILDFLTLERISSNISPFYIAWYTIPNRDTIAIGEVGEILNENLLQKKQTWVNGIPNGIKYLIEFSHKHHPYQVGGQVNIMEITRKKIRWIGGKKPPCY